MERTTLRVQITPFEDPKGIEWNGRRIRLNRHGADNAEFLISPNPGEPLRPLGKIASGGELSRMMLAMKSIFARHDRIPVLIFDEVDTGVSGRAGSIHCGKTVPFVFDLSGFLNNSLTTSGLYGRSSVSH